MPKYVMPVMPLITRGMNVVRDGVEGVVKWCMWGPAIFAVFLFPSMDRVGVSPEEVLLGGVANGVGRLEVDTQSHEEEGRASDTEGQELGATQPAFAFNVPPGLPLSRATFEGEGTRRGEGEEGEEGGGGGEGGREASNTEHQELGAIQPALVSDVVPGLPPSRATSEGGDTRRGEGEEGEEGGGGGDVEGGGEVLELDPQSPEEEGQAPNTEHQEFNSSQPAFVSNVAPALPPSFATPARCVMVVLFIAVMLPLVLLLLSALSGQSPRGNSLSWNTTATAPSGPKVTTPPPLPATAATATAEEQAADTAAAAAAAAAADVHFRYSPEEKLVAAIKKQIAAAAAKKAAAMAHGARLMHAAIPSAILILAYASYSLS
jgi:hypothetical protein